MPSKSEFIRLLQVETIGLGPYEISQRLRNYAGCISSYFGDPNLDIADYRAYMIRFPRRGRGTPENPELYQCVISLRQSKQWQDLVWTKEILGVLDAPEDRTNDRESLGNMIDNRDLSSVPDNAQLRNVAADLNGLVLALGCMIPGGYRATLRREDFIGKYSTAVLQNTLGIPEEHIAELLNETFEEKFEWALSKCDV